MAVFTPVSRPDLEHWLAGFELGALVSHEGISSGIENTNYFVTSVAPGTTQPLELVLTIIEDSTEPSVFVDRKSVV